MLIFLLILKQGKERSYHPKIEEIIEAGYIGEKVAFLRTKCVFENSHSSIFKRYWEIQTETKYVPKGWSKVISVFQYFQDETSIYGIDDDSASDDDDDDEEELEDEQEEDSDIGEEEEEDDEDLKDELADSDIDGMEEDDLPNIKAWGKNKRMYYNTDYQDDDHGGELVEEH